MGMNAPAVTTGSIQQRLLDRKRQNLRKARRGYLPGLLSGPPTHSRPFIVTSQPFPNYPLNGAAAVVLLTFQVPQGQIAALTQIAIVHIGGGFVDGSGNVVWRVLVNGAPVDGMQNLQAQVGSLPIPQDLFLLLNENDILSISVEVPAGKPDMPPQSTTGAKLLGWTLPIAEAIQR